MKNIFIIALLALSFNSFAQSKDYACDVRQYRVELILTPDTSTSFFLMDMHNYQTLANGFAANITREKGLVTYHFYPGNAHPMKLTFREDDVNNMPDKMRGYIETKARGYLLWDYVNCRKR